MLGHAISARAFDREDAQDGIDVHDPALLSDDERRECPRDRHWPVALTAMTKSNSSCRVSITELDELRPALLTMPYQPYPLLVMVCTAVAMSSGFVISRRTPCTF